MTKFQVQVRCVVAIVWALIIMFAFTGVLLNRVEAVFTAVVAVVMWTMMRIVNEGIAAVQLLRALKNDPEAQAEDDQ